MTRNSVYVNSSDLDTIKIIKNEPSFEHISQYDPYAYPKAHQNEFGRLKTPLNYYHFIIGQVHQENCPWCGGPPLLKRIKHDDGLGFSIYALECIRCGSRGPLLNVSSQRENDKEFMDECQNLMFARYKRRRTWDDDIKQLLNNNQS